MSDRALAWTLRGIVATGAVFGVVGSVLLHLGGHSGLLWSKFGVHNALGGLFLAVIVWLACGRQPRNKAVWSIALVSLGGFYVAGLAAAAMLVDDPSRFLDFGMAPADIPPAAAWIMVFAVPAGSIGWYSMATLGVLLFPDGRLPSSRWRGVALLAAAGVALSGLGQAWSHRPTSPINSDRLVAAGRLIVVIAALLALASLVGRFRRSRGPTRQQLKWIAWGLAIFVLVIAVNIIISDSANADSIRLPSLVAGTLLFTSYGLGLTNYRRFDVDAVISRTFVYGVSALFITGVYLATVVGLGRLIGSGDEPNTVLAIGATTVVAVTFQPLRRWLQRVANRMVYGRRATPYEVLSTFSQRVAALDPEVLASIARSLAEGTSAEAAQVWMKRGASFQLMAAWPPDVPAPPEPDGSRGSESHRAVPVTHHGEQLGLVTLRLSSGQPFTPADGRLLDQVASGLGLVLRNLKLTEELRTRVDQLRESRRRIVAAQDRTRHKLERDLHDGAQQRLVALKIKLGLGVSMADRAGLEELSRSLTDLRDQVGEAIEVIRDFARGIYPPLLEADGLGAALTAYSRKLPLPVVVHAAGIGRYPRPVEATIFFCVREALHNAIVHAEASSIVVTVEAKDGVVGFAVRDDGLGFDPETVSSGSGLTNLADRVHAVDGTLDVSSSPGAGTTVTGVIPVRQMEPVA